MPERFRVKVIDLKTGVVDMSRTIFGACGEEECLTRDVSPDPTMPRLYLRDGQ